jgi:hypothetical protein
MTFPFEHYIYSIAKRTIIQSPVIDVDDLCQVGRMAYLSIIDKPMPYILTSIKNAIYKYANKFLPSQSLKDIERSSLSEMTPLNYFSTLSKSNLELIILTDHYINGISVKQLSESFRISKSSIYRILNNSKREMMNV